jgi:hypothetical protein
MCLVGSEDNRFSIRDIIAMLSHGTKSLKYSISEGIGNYDSPSRFLIVYYNFKARFWFNFELLSDTASKFTFHQPVFTVL